MDISIVIPLYNSEEHIEETLLSVQNQSYNNWECIIVDDHCTDNSKAIINKFLIDKRFSYYLRPKSEFKGVSTCRNIGVNNSNSEYIIFLDSDDLMKKNCVQDRLRFIEKHTDYDFWIFKMEKYSEKLNTTSLVNSLPISSYKCEKEFYLDEFYKAEIPFAVTCPVWKKKLFLEVGGFDKHLIRLEDPDIHFRLMKKDNVQVITNYNSYPDCIYRVGYESKPTIETFDKADNYIRFAKKHLNNSIKSRNLLNNLFLKKIILYKSNYHFTELKKIGLSNHLLSKWEIKILDILFFYRCCGLHKFKGFGYTKIVRYYRSLVNINK